MNERSDIFIALLLVGIFVVIALPSAYVVQGTLTGLSISEVMTQYIPEVPALLGAAMLILLVMTIIYRSNISQDEAHLKFTQLAERNEQIDESAHKLQSFVQQELRAGRKAKHVKKALIKHGWKKQTAEKYVEHALPKMHPVVKQKKVQQDKKEKKELPLPQQMIDNFVKTSLRNGASADDIKRVLLSKGWSRDHVNSIVGKISKRAKATEKLSYDDELPRIERELQKLGKNRHLL